MRRAGELRLDRIGLWVLVAFALIVLAYAPFATSYLPSQLASPASRLF